LERTAPTACAHAIRNVFDQAILKDCGEPGEPDDGFVISTRLRGDRVQYSLQLAASEDDHLFDEPRGSRGEHPAVGGYLIGDQGDVLVAFLRDECKNM